jgi:hypothetical protein
LAYEHVLERDASSHVRAYETLGVPWDTLSRALSAMHVLKHVPHVMVEEQHVHLHVYVYGALHLMMLQFQFQRLLILFRKSFFSPFIVITLFRRTRNDFIQ